MTQAIEALTHNVKIKYPHLLEDGVTIVDYFFINCDNREELPVKKFGEVKQFLDFNKIKNFALVILFSNNIIGYRLEV